MRAWWGLGLAAIVLMSGCTEGSTEARSQPSSPPQTIAPPPPVQILEAVRRDACKLLSIDKLSGSLGSARVVSGAGTAECAWVVASNLLSASGRVQASIADSPGAEVLTGTFHDPVHLLGGFAELANFDVSSSTLTAIVGPVLFTLSFDFSDKASTDMRTVLAADFGDEAFAHLTGARPSEGALDPCQGLNADGIYAELGGKVGSPTRDAGMTGRCTWAVSSTSLGDGAVTVAVVPMALGAFYRECLGRKDHSTQVFSASPGQPSIAGCRWSDGDEVIAGYLRGAQVSIRLHLATPAAGSAMITLSDFMNFEIQQANV